MSDTVHIHYYIRTGVVGSKCEGVAEFDRDEWEAMSPEHKELEMKELAFNEMEWGYSVQGSDDE